MNKHPAPWSLKGKGYILLYRFGKKIPQSNLFLPPYLQDKLWTGFGTIMIVDYTESNAGPYQELLFIPGQYKSSAGKHYAITKIYVSTETSIINGKANWAIPKELAEFSFSTDHNAESIKVLSPPASSNTQQSESQQVFFQTRIKPWGPRFPVNTKWFNLFLRQQGIEDKMYYYTKLIARGKARLARVKDMTIDQRFFPDASTIKPLLALYIPDFYMQFPVPTIQND